MWIDKLAEGVLQVDTPIGPRFVRLNFKQRAYLLWMFRNFPSLPHQVLSSREQRMIDRACEENGFASMPGMGAADAPVIGRIEKRLTISAEVLPMRKPAAGSQSGVRERESEAASA
jgi:hypothetical protein